MRTINLVSVILVLVCTTASFAATITVRQDGSGDFTQIQPALDACASGDTLLIGPGEYMESNPSYIPGYAWDVDVFAYVHVAELTIIGAGSDQTVIGPTVFQGDGQTFSPKGLVWLDGVELRVSGVTLRNCFEGIHATNAPIFVDDCLFEDNKIGFGWFSEDGGGGVFNSVFNSQLSGSDGVFFVGNGHGVEIDNCLFDGASITVQSLDSVSVRDCEIRNVVVGLHIDNGTYCLVEDSRIYNCVNYGAGVLSSGAVGEFRNCEVSGDGGAVFVGGHCNLLATDTAFFGGFWAGLEFQNAESSQVSNCHIIPGTGPAIRSFHHPDFGEVTHDLRHNYWGTSDAEDVRDLILDGIDDPENTSIVLFEPIASLPIFTPVEDDPFEVPHQPHQLVVYPNPFNPVTTISYRLSDADVVSLVVYDLVGHVVRVLVDEYQVQGEHQATWKGIDEGGRAMPSGTYFIRIKSSEGAEVQKVSLVR